MKILDQIHVKAPVWLIIAGLGLLLISCSSKDPGHFRKDLIIIVDNESLRLEVDEQMRFRIFYKSIEKRINVLKERSTNYLFVNGEEIADFQLLPELTRRYETESKSGDKFQTEISGVSESSGLIQKITFTASTSDMAIIYKVDYKNPGKEPIKVDQIHNANIVLEGSDFWSYQGASVGWGKDYILKIEKGFYQENYMGVQKESKTGGGNPIVDIWNKDFGIALAHIEKEPRQVSFPVEVKQDNQIDISIVDFHENSIPPMGSVSSVRSTIILHSLDYFEPLQIWSGMMADRGMKMNDPSPEAYDPIWCGWGYGFDFTAGEIMGTLPMVEQLGIKWVVIDDRWFDKYGDWNPREDNFPGGEEQIKQMVKELHDKGYKVKIWWLPTSVQGSVIRPDSMNWINYDFGISKVAQDHPEWLILDRNGNADLDSRFLWNLCPSVPQVRDYIRDLTEKFIKEWDFDGHKLDAYYVISSCYNPAHQHERPGESYAQLPELFRIIYETTKRIKPEAVVEICNCGTTQDFYQSIWTDQPVTSDPVSSVQVRRRIKSMKALWGVDAPVYADQVEFINEDFASGIGPGGVVGTRFTWPDSNNGKWKLTDEKQAHYKKWMKLYKEKMLPKGEYLNLYDIVFDWPETHVIRKGDTLFYAFYADRWNGQVELRGLQMKDYKIIDYENNTELGIVNGNHPGLNLTFEKHQLIECIPDK